MNYIAANCGFGPAIVCWTSDEGGGQLIHAATRYGVQCLGIARERIRGPECRTGVRLRFSPIAIFASAASSTTIASVGMCEHVVESQLDQYFRRAWQLLLRGGAFLNHGLARSAAYHPSPTSFTDVYVFPGGELVPLASRSCT
ncbi:MAG: class I SAM-dependent methyltransferase [Acidobacteria bacterium]|nr:class I SAM-dependent methyltransferase [Acidobacteriota bacterium]